MLENPDAAEETRVAEAEAKKEREKQERMEQKRLAREAKLQAKSRPTTPPK